MVTGFLGAGKSTLVDRWLAELGEHVAVIVNEWGDVGIDGELLAARGARLMEITGGCLCCTSQAEMSRALATLAAADPAPDRVLVETSGAASPAGVLTALTRGAGRERMRLDGVITVVDGTRLEVLEVDLAVEQLSFADVVVVSHADEAVVSAATGARLMRRAPAAVMAYAARGVVRGPDGADLSLGDLLERREEALHLPEGSPDPAPAHDHCIDSVALRHEGDLDEERFIAWVSQALGEVEARILRIKGIVAVAGVEARVIVQGVGQAIEVTVGRPWAQQPRNSRLVVLGLDLDADLLERGFTACAVD